jgi:hypothetical protein
MNGRHNSRFVLMIPGVILLFAFMTSSRVAGQAPARVGVLPQTVVDKLIAGPAPTGVTLSAVTATNIQVEWSPAPGAVRYVISRNGAADVAIDANAGFLQGNRYVYTDVGRRPATLHTYMVTALYAAPTQPGRSTPAQLVTPSASAPQNFKAVVSAPNTVTLTWAPRPEATGYRIVRNGGNLPAVSFNASGVIYVDKNMPAGQYTYIVSSVVRSATGEDFGGAFSNPVTVLTRPFNMVAFGDSVVWGQGLLPEHKFATKVQNWIQSDFGRTVTLNLRAHSGAITFAESSPVSSQSFAGEVPEDGPTISQQIDLASSPGSSNPALANDVDLVLIDGCLNNLNILDVLNPVGNDDTLRTDTQGYCQEGMINLLRQVVQKFPNAAVVVTGYYPFISNQSDLAALLPVFTLIGAAIPPDPLIGGIVAMEALRARSAARSDEFFQQSNINLQTAVDTVNSMPLPGRTKFNQIRFARLNAGPANSYAAPNTWEWLVPTPPITQDEVYDLRKSQCNQALSGNPKAIECWAASMGHPNVAGAQAFASTIQSIAAPLLAPWRTELIGPVLAADDSVALRVQLGPIEAAGGTVLISATDGGGRPLQGTIQFNGVLSGPLGAQLRYAYQQTQPGDIQVRIDIPNHQPRFFSIPVRAFSVAVNVTNNGNPRTVSVTASDTVTGQPLSGTLTVANAVSGRTGQPLTYPACAQRAAGASVAVVNAAGTCSGTVHVPYYRDVVYQDVPAMLNTIEPRPPQR